MKKNIWILALCLLSGTLPVFAGKKKKKNQNSLNALLQQNSEDLQVKKNNEKSEQEYIKYLQDIIKGGKKLKPFMVKMLTQKFFQQAYLEAFMVLTELCNTDKELWRILLENSYKPQLQVYNMARGNSKNHDSRVLLLEELVKKGRWKTLNNALQSGAMTVDFDFFGCALEWEDVSQKSLCKLFKALWSKLQKRSAIKIYDGYADHVITAFKQKRFKVIKTMLSCVSCKMSQGGIAKKQIITAMLGNSLECDVDTLMDIYKSLGIFQANEDKVIFLSELASLGDEKLFTYLINNRKWNLFVAGDGGNIIMYMLNNKNYTDKAILKSLVFIKKLITKKQWGKLMWPKENVFFSPLTLALLYGKKKIVNYLLKNADYCKLGNVLSSLIGYVVHQKTTKFDLLRVIKKFVEKSRNDKCFYKLFSRDTLYNVFILLHKRKPEIIKYLFTELCNDEKNKKDAASCLQNVIIDILLAESEVGTISLEEKSKWVHYIFEEATQDKKIKDILVQGCKYARPLFSALENQQWDLVDYLLAQGTKPWNYPEMVEKSFVTRVIWLLKDASDQKTSQRINSIFQAIILTSNNQLTQEQLRKIFNPCKDIAPLTYTIGAGSYKKQTIDTLMQYGACLDHQHTIRILEEILLYSETGKACLKNLDRLFDTVYRYKKDNASKSYILDKCSVFESVLQKYSVEERQLIVRKLAFYGVLFSKKLYNIHLENVQLLQSYNAHDNAPEIRSIAISALQEGVPYRVDKHLVKAIRNENAPSWKRVLGRCALDRYALVDHPKFQKTVDQRLQQERRTLYALGLAMHNTQKTRRVSKK